MIKILFVVPYPKLEVQVCKIYKEIPFHSKIDLRVIVKTVEELGTLKEIDNMKSFDVLIARGYSAIRLKKLYPNIPIVSIDITAYDILQCIYDCKKKYNAKRISLIGNFSKYHNIKLLEKILDCQIHLLYSKEDDIKDNVHLAIKQGYDAIVGGYSVYLESRRLKHPASAIETGEEAIQIALSEAKNIGEAVEVEREKSEKFRNVTERLQMELYI